MLCNIPDNIEGSFYRVQVNIGLKDAAFQASSALRHMTELYDILLHTEMHHPFLMLYTDGGPDHKNTFLRVQLSLIAMFIALDLDYLVAVRTPPGHSWKNPVKRIMSILNLGLQGVTIVCENMSDEMEDLFNKYNKLEKIRQAAKSNALLETELKNSIKTIQDLLNNRTKRLVLNENNFVCKTPATNEDIENFFEVFTFLYF